MYQIALSKSTEEVFFYSSDRGDSSEREKTRNLSTKKIMQFFFKSTFGKCNLTQLTTDMMLSGQRFVILAMFFCGEVA